MTSVLACSRSSVSGSVRAAGERGDPRFRALSLPRLFSLAAVFVRYHRLSLEQATSVLVMRSCYASDVILESGKQSFPGEARSAESDTNSVITPTVIAVCGVHQLDE